jgi:hypothetical protein
MLTSRPPPPACCAAAGPLGAPAWKISQAWNFTVRRYVRCSASRDRHSRAPTQDDDDGAALLEWAVDEASTSEARTAALNREDAASIFHHGQRRVSTVDTGTGQQQQKRKQHVNKQSSSGDGNNKHSSSSSSSSAAAYQELQRRVRAVLVSADARTPAATAEALPEGPDAAIIALQLLATAPRPPGAQHLKRYEAAARTLGAAVLAKLKRMLLEGEKGYVGHLGLGGSSQSKDVVPVHPQQQQQQQQQSMAMQQDCSQPASVCADAEVDALKSALQRLPPTRIAAATFSLGVLRLYDAALLPALESASLQLLRRCSAGTCSSSSGGGSSRGRSGSSFTANQLGQLSQGFVYLDYQLNPAWQEAFLEAALPLLPSLAGPQLSSVAALLIHMRGYASRDDVPDAAPPPAQLPERLLPAAAAAAAGVGLPPDALPPRVLLLPPPPLPPAWLPAFLTAAGAAAPTMTAGHLTNVLVSAAGMRRELRAAAGSSGEGSSSRSNVAAAGSASAGDDADTATAAAAMAVSQAVLAGLPVPMPHPGAPSPQLQRRSSQGHTTGAVSTAAAAAAAAGTANSADAALSGATVLLAALLTALPEASMAQLAAALPAAGEITIAPWPPAAARVALLQAHTALSRSSGPDAAAVAAALVTLAPRPELDAAAAIGWGDALLSRLHTQLPRLGGAALVQALAALAALRLSPYEAWRSELWAALRLCAGGLNCTALLSLLDSLAALAMPPDPEVLSLLVMRLSACRGCAALTAARGVGAVRAAAALRTLYPRALPGRTVATLVAQLEAAAAALEFVDGG